MGQHTDATIEANEANAREGYVVPAPWGFFLLDGRWPDHIEPILAWRIGRDPECNCVLPVTATGTHCSQTYVLFPDGKVRYNAIGYGSAPPDFESLEAWKADCTAPGSYYNPAKSGPSDFGYEPSAHNNTDDKLLF